MNQKTGNEALRAAAEVTATSRKELEDAIDHALENRVVTRIYIDPPLGSGVSADVGHGSYLRKRTTMSDYRAAHVAARVAFDRANVDTVYRQWDDAHQEAIMAIWRNQARGEAYSFVCGKNAVLKFIFDFMREDRSHRPGAWTDVGRISHVQLSGSFFVGDSPEEAMIARENAAERATCLEEMADLLLEIFRSGRKQQVGRAARAAVRDTNIVLLTLQGNNHEAIAHKLAIKPRHVKHYLQMARQKINEYMEKENVSLAE